MVGKTTMLAHWAYCPPLGRFIDREFEFYEFFSFLKFNEFYQKIFPVKKISNFSNHRCLTRFDVLECNVHL